MNYDEVLNKLEENYTSLSKACKQDIIANLKMNTYKGGEVVVREGQYSKKAYLIVSGCARAYYLKDGKDISDWFAFENEFMASIVSFFTEDPSPHYVEFIEDSVVLEFSRDTIDTLSKEHHDFERLISKVVTQTMLGLRERLSSILFNKATERYKQFIATRPDIITRIPLTHIASYIGITLETLSRIRNPRNQI